MGDLCVNSNDVSSQNGLEHYVRLKKDKKAICRMKCSSLPGEMYADLPFDGPLDWSISHFEPHTVDLGLPRFFLSPDPENSYQQREYQLFSKYLVDRQKVAVGKLDVYQFYIHPPTKGSKFFIASYRLRNTHTDCNSQQNIRSGTEITLAKKECKAVQPIRTSATPCVHGRLSSDIRESSYMPEDRFSPDHKSIEVVGDHETGTSLSEPSARVKNVPVEKFFAKTDPSYLKTLGQIHSGWIFGAIAELVDNSRDAKAATLKISIEMIYSKQAGKDIPMLSVIDDGHGMTHLEILRLITFGHKQPDADDPNHIGRFGVGFKTGAMRLGKDALVLTQTSNSRSLAFLSQSLNERKDNLEVPIVSYSLQGQIMEVDLSIQSKASAKYNLKAIKNFSPFNKYLIGEKEALFKEKGRGTQIYIWNLDEWGFDYCVEWVNGICGGSSFHKGDILIRSRRCRSRPGQMARKVQLDFSLRAYLEVMFFDPRMKIYVQGSMVNSRPLAKSLNKTVLEHGKINGKAVQLILGRCQLEWEQANCGIFLYWHGRLIEAYKRVGGMLHNGDRSHGIIGVIDVYDLMDDGNGGSWVHNNKQSFQDCEVYALLEDWLGKKVDEYLDNNFDKLEVRKGTSLCKPDHEWVQCDKCRKWRMLRPDFDSKTLPQDWFCYMKPYSGSCETPEQKIEPGLITISAKRSDCNPMDNPTKQNKNPIRKINDRSEDIIDDYSNQNVEDGVNLQSLKRLTREPLTRSCKKKK